MYSVCAFRKTLIPIQANLLKNHFPQSINVHSMYKTFMVPVRPIRKLSVEFVLVAFLCKIIFAVAYL